jgi:hypothetical protein
MSDGKGFLASARHRSALYFVVRTPQSVDDPPMRRQAHHDWRPLHIPSINTCRRRHQSASSE